MVKQAINDVHPGIRENGLILGERYTGCKPGIIKRMNDTSVRVAFQACLSAGKFASNEIFPSFTKIIEKYGYDEWFRLAILSSNEGSSLAFIRWLSKKSNFFNSPLPEKLIFIQDVSYVIATRNAKGEIISLLNFTNQGAFATHEKWMVNILTGINTSFEMEETKPVLGPALSEKLKLVAVNT